jgi:hypothetical protein
MVAPVDVVIEKTTEAIICLAVAIWALLKVVRSFKKEAKK